MKSKMQRLMNQTVQHEALISESLAGTAIFAAAVPIKARVVNQETLITDDDGRHILSETKVYTETAIKKGDRLGGRIAAKITECLLRGGAIDHMEVYLK